jgi:transposase
MASIAPSPASVSRPIVGGIDTHKDLHVGAVIDAAEKVLGTASFPTTRPGYGALVRWMCSFGELRRVGVEGTGSYGAGIGRHLAAAGVEVVEVFRPDRADRRLRGKTDDLDAISAARAPLHDRRTATPKRRDGLVEALRVLRLTRSTAVKSKVAALQLLRNEIVSAPEELRDQVRSLSRMKLVRTLASWRPDRADFRDPTGATRIALRSLARRIVELDDEVAPKAAPMAMPWPRPSTACTRPSSSGRRVPGGPSIGSSSPPPPGSAGGTSGVFIRPVGTSRRQSSRRRTTVTSRRPPRPPDHNRPVA